MLLENQEVHGFNDMKSLRKLLIENTPNKKQRQFLTALVLFLVLVATIVAVVVATKTPRVIEVINLQSKEVDNEGKFTKYYFLKRQIYHLPKR